jgi:hypothetical protein
MYNAVSGGKKSPTDQGELTGILQKLGYDKEQVHRSLRKGETNNRFTNFRFAVIGRMSLLSELENRKCVTSLEKFCPVVSSPEDTYVTRA